MNTAELKTYAPEARRVFIAAVTAQAARLGISAQGNATAQVQCDVLLIEGQAFPASVDAPRKKLIEQIEQHGFDQTMRCAQPTWHAVG